MRQPACMCRRINILFPVYKCIRPLHVRVIFTCSCSKLFHIYTHLINFILLPSSTIIHFTVPESQSNCMTQWLSSLGLSSENASSYASIFHRQAITEKALHLLSLQDLESIGVATFGHRILIHNTLNGGISCKKSVLTKSNICQQIVEKIPCLRWD